MPMPIFQYLSCNLSVKCLFQQIKDTIEQSQQYIPVQVFLYSV